MNLCVETAFFFVYFCVHEFDCFRHGPTHGLS